METVEMPLRVGALAVVGAALLLLLRVLLPSIQNRLGRAPGLPARLRGPHAPPLLDLARLLGAARPAGRALARAAKLVVTALGLAVEAVPLVERIGVGRGVGGEVDEVVVGRGGKEVKIGRRRLPSLLDRISVGGMLAEGVDGALELPARLGRSHAPWPRSRSRQSTSRKRHKGYDLQLHVCEFSETGSVVRIGGLMGSWCCSSRCTAVGFVQQSR